jgi:hypothetical protein
MQRQPPADHPLLEQDPPHARHQRQLGPAGTGDKGVDTAGRFPGLNEGGAEEPGDERGDDVGVDAPGQLGGLPAGAQGEVEVAGQQRRPGTAEQPPGDEHGVARQPGRLDRLVEHLGGYLQAPQHDQRGSLGLDQLREQLALPGRPTDLKVPLGVGHRVVVAVQVDLGLHRSLTASSRSASSWSGMESIVAAASDR